jgi:Zn-dependent peptidase ImmA (M78 family)
MKVRWGLVRSQADALLQTYGGRASVAVDIDAIAEKLNLPVFQCELPDDVSGMLVVNNGSEYGIYLNQNNIPARQRFTLAHEIGHYCLGHDLGLQGVHVDRGYRVSALRNRRSSEGTDPREIEANEFAANLLMPAQRLASAVASARTYRQQNWLCDEDIYNLATQFEVSPIAMSYRLQRLGFV